MEEDKYIITIDLKSGEINFNLNKLSLDQDSFRKLIVDNSKIFCTILKEYEDKYGTDDHKLHHLKKNLIDYLKY